MIDTRAIIPTVEDDPLYECGFEEGLKKEYK